MYICIYSIDQFMHPLKWNISFLLVDGILPKGPYPPCLGMADMALLAGYPRCVTRLKGHQMGLLLRERRGVTSNHYMYV